MSSTGRSAMAARLGRSSGLRPGLR